MEPIKILCIDDSGTGGKHPYLEVGNLYEPVGEGLTVEGIPGWIIPGLPPTVSLKARKKNSCAIYNKSRFVTFPEETADQMTELEKEAIIR